MMKKISRRDFLGGMTAGGISIALSGIFGGTISMAEEEENLETVSNGEETSALAISVTDEQYQADAELARTIAEESIVLLENKENLLPLAEGSTIAVFGTGQQAYWKSGCDGSAAISSLEETTLIDGLQALDGRLVLNEEILSLYQSNSEDFMYAPEDEEIISAAADSEIAIVIISRTGGESADLVVEEEPGSNDVPWQQRYYYLHEQEERIISAVCDNFKKVIVLINAGSMLDISWTQEYEIDALLYVGLPGMRGGAAIANILIGDVNPSGKLVDTWAWSLEDIPSTENIWTFVDGYETVVTTGTMDEPGTYTVYAGAYYDQIPEDAQILSQGNQSDLWVYYNNGAPKFSEAVEYTAGQYVRALEEHFYSMYEEGIFVGYRYFQTFDVDVAYCFGYGLSYTEFSVDVKSVDCSDDAIMVTVTVTNDGSCAGKETVQIYYSQPQGSAAKAAIELGAFGKTDLLEPGESQTLMISYDPTYMYTFYEMYTEEGGAYVMDAGDYTILVGTSLQNAETASVYTLDEAKIVFGGLEKATEIQEKYEDTFTEYDGTDETYPDASDLFRSYLTNMTGFSYLEEGEEGYMYYIGKPDTVTTIPSGFSEDVKAAAESAKKTEVEYSLYDVYAGNCTMGTFLAQMDPVELVALVVGAGNTAEGDLFITTAVNSGNSTRAIERLGISSINMTDGPHGAGSYGLEWPGETNQAMSWNPALIQEMGERIGEELNTIDTDLWLAPNLNLHRNPLTGRNAEAYSEDPVVTGIISTASVRGVQSTGSGVTVKHFVNYDVQSTGWYDLDTVIGERTLRELYLKGYQICVEDANPWAMMSSYAMLNGSFSSAASGINETVLRDEWGWEGILMTDWEGHGGQDINALTNGTNLLMPGFDASVSYIYDAYLQCLKDGSVSDGNSADIGLSITREDLETDAANILSCIMKTKAFSQEYGLDEQDWSDYYESLGTYMTVMAK